MFAARTIVPILCAAAFCVAAAVPGSAIRKRAYLRTSQDGGEVTQVEPGMRVVAAVADPGDIAASPDGLRLFVTHPEKERISVIRASDGRIEASFPYPGTPFGITLDADTRHLFVGDWTRSVGVYDAQTLSSVAKIPVGTAPFGLAY